jgi:protein ImuA
MQKHSDENLVQELRSKLDKITGGQASQKHAILPFGVEPIDEHLPDGGLRLGALHEVAGGGNGAVDGAVAALFSAGIAARVPGNVLWCVTRRDLFMPAMAQVGLDQNRLFIAECRDDNGVLESCEEALRCNGFSVVIGEASRFSLNASRRLQLAAERSGVMSLVIRRWRHHKGAAEFNLPTAALTRWQVSARPSTPLPVPGIGRARWSLELLRCRGGVGAVFEVEACDAKGRLNLPSDMVNRPLSAPAWSSSAIG